LPEGHCSADLADREQTNPRGRRLDGGAVARRAGVWQELWPRIMASTIEACKRAEAKLVFFDNVYMYGKVAGPMTENTPYAPCSKKGEIRAKIAAALMNEVQAGGLSAMIVRSADFYGPDTQKRCAKRSGLRASWEKVKSIVVGQCSSPSLVNLHA